MHGQQNIKKKSLVEVQDPSEERPDSLYKLAEDVRNTFLRILDVFVGNYTVCVVLPTGPH